MADIAVLPGSSLRCSARCFTGQCCNSFSTSCGIRICNSRPSNMIGNVDPSSRFIADKQPPRCVWTAGIGNFRTDPGSYPCGRCQGGQNEPAWIGWTPLRWLSADSHLHDFTRLPGHDIDATSSELHCSTRHDCMWFGRFKAIERGSAHMLGLRDIAYSRHITHNYVQSPAAILSELSWEHWVQCCRQRPTTITTCTWELRIYSYRGYL